MIQKGRILEFEEAQEIIKTNKQTKRFYLLIGNSHRKQSAC